MTVEQEIGCHGDQLSDGDLAQGIARGDRAAGAALIERHQSMVRGFLWRLSGRRDLADDLAQETFMRVLRYAHRFDPKYAMRTWLLTIARRLWINSLRRDSRQVAGPLLGDQVADEPSPAEQFHRTEELGDKRRLLDEAMLGLTEPQRTALVLFYQQDLPLAEAARVMEIPIGTVKSHLHRGRAALRRILAPKLESAKR